MLVKLNTNLCPIIDVGMYESYISLTSRLDETDYNVRHSDNITDEDKAYYFINADIDCERYKADIASIAIEHIKAFFDDIRHIVSVLVYKNASVYSPRFYNYGTDELDFEIEIEQSEVDKIITAVQDNDEFFHWASNRYPSYDGFISFMPCRKDEYMEGIRDPESSDFDRALAMYFMWLLKEINMDTNGYYTVYQAGFEEDVFEQTWAEDYLEDARVHEILRKVG